MARIPSSFVFPEKIKQISKNKNGVHATKGKNTVPLKKSKIAKAREQIGGPASARPFFGWLGAVSGVG
ncbi:MAG: hypothetical protein AAF591_04085 [Verrucomicrobiota bacterium]